MQGIQKNVRTSWKFLVTPLVKKSGGKIPLKKENIIFGKEN